jgi:hypothetical protein
MAIIVIDQGPELFWFVSTSLVEYGLPLKHIQNTQIAEQCIMQESPELVIISGDDKTLEAESFIYKIRNDIFSKNTPFLIITANTAYDFKKNLLKAGAGQVLYRNNENELSRERLLSEVKWFMTKENPDPLLFAQDAVVFSADAEFTSYDRLGWISETQCLIETNLDIKIGQTTKIKSALFDELDIEDVLLTCTQINTTGRYHFQKNSIIFEISSRYKNKDFKKIKAWIENNKTLSKPKPIKIIYFEDDISQIEKILPMVKFDNRIYSRGYRDIVNLKEVLNSQIPNLIILNRDLIKQDLKQFEMIKQFVKNNFCYCVTYSNKEPLEINDFKNDYPFAMHSKIIIDLTTLNTMIEMLMSKLPEKLKPVQNRFYFDKNSPYSFLSLISECKIREMSLDGLRIDLSTTVDNFSLCEISSHIFTNIGINRIQQLRTFVKMNKIDISNDNNFRLIFIGQHQRELMLIKESLEQIKQSGFEAWSKN